MRKTTWAILATLLLAVPVSAQLPLERKLELARVLARGMLGLSPAGTEVYASRSVHFNSDESRFEALSRLKVAFGDELARNTPDRRRLLELNEEMAMEAARIARVEGKEVVATALALPAADRRKLGQAIARNHGSGFGLP